LEHAARQHSQVPRLPEKPARADIYGCGGNGAQTLDNIYVDNLVITSVLDKEVQHIKAEMKAQFKMCDLRLPSYLGIELHQRVDDITEPGELHQSLGGGRHGQLQYCAHSNG
jgi:hypothetical protein